MTRRAALDACARIASPNTIVPAAWLIAVVVPPGDDAAQMAVGTSLAVVAADLLKHYISRRRPRLSGSTPFQSFPSGHSAASTAFLVGLALLARPAHRAVALGAACAGALTVNALRVLARQHWPLDVLAGDALGLAGIATTRVASRAVRPPTDERSTPRRR